MPSLLRYFRPKCAERCRRLGSIAWITPSYMVFTLKIARILHQWTFSTDRNIYHTDTILMRGNLNNYHTYH